ncbi:MAG TPA: ABC transporter ATP-binding protein [Methanomassiliicoccales archaeon]|jgi:ABC-2 type transport system ATP-binding protein
MVRDGEIVCSDIGKVFSTGKKALTSVDFSIPANGIFALIGRNGAGKTTLTRILSTLLEPSSGKATIEGLDVMADAKILRERMSIVPQEGRAVQWMTPLQSVSSYLLWRGMTYKESRSKGSEALARVGLAEVANRLNRTLSGGMKRKVLVAMVIAAESDYIFLDEPTTGLDPISRQEIWNLMTDLSKDRFMFLTTHYLEEAERVADRIGILDNGRLLALGSMNDLRKRIRHQYSVKVPHGVDLPEVEGEVLARKDGQVQIMTTQDEALRLSRILIEKKTQFSLNPIDLDDIFSDVVGGGTMNDEDGGK